MIATPGKRRNCAALFELIRNVDPYMRKTLGDVHFYRCSTGAQHFAATLAAAPALHPDRPAARQTQIPEIEHTRATSMLFATPTACP